MKAAQAMKGAQVENYVVNNNPKVDEARVKKLKTQVLETQQKLDTERLKVLRDVYRETEGLPQITRRAKVLERLLTTKGLYIDENIFVGSMGSSPMALYSYPEWSFGWMKKSGKAMSHLGEVAISDEDRQLFAETMEYWDGKTLDDRANKIFMEKYGFSPLLPQMVGLFYAASTTPQGGGNLDQKKVLHKGIAGIINDIEEKMKPLTASKADAQKMLFYESCLISLKAVITWAHRYAQLARDMAAKEENKERSQELLEIADICEWVPENSPRTFREALQSLFFVQMALQIEQVGCGYSWGYLGQDLEPFYQRDKQAGIITKEQAKYELKNFFIKLQEIGYYAGQDFAKANSSDMGQTINIGGCTADGRDATGEVDYLLLVTQAEIKNTQPTFALMYHDNLKEDFLFKAVDLVRSGVGQPQFMNYNLAVARSLDQFGPDGVTLADARRTAVAGCVTTSIAAKTASPVESTVCVAKAFELALNDGKDPLMGKQIGPQTGAAETFTNFEELFAAFRKQLDFGMTASRNHGKICCMLAAEFLQPPLRSSFTGGCIEKGLDCWNGGANYSVPVYILNGAVDTANSLASVKKLVFEDKKLTMEELKKALEANFVGYEKVKKMCLAAPKHGNDEEEMTALVRRVYDNMLESYKQTGPCYLGKQAKAECYSKSLHNLNGAMMGALPNGREARIALTDGSVSAMPGTDTHGPTALANSAALAEDAVAFTSNHLNVKFHPSAIEGGAGARNLISLVKGYMDKGGSHIQFNCVKGETLQDAQAHPEKYKDLIVRVAGFSAYFVNLDKGVQDEIIKRTEHKLH